MNNKELFRTPKVTVLVVTFNGFKYLPALISSIYNQSYQDFRLMIVDNASSDETVSYIRKNYPQISLFENRQNLGFAKAYNKGIKLSKSEYILISNQDIVFTPRFLENLINYADLEPKIASFGGKLLRFDNSQESKSPHYIDSLGLKVLKSRQVINLGGGEEDKRRDETPYEVFGISAALALFRRRDLELIVVNDEYFDEDFFMYKEDIDLAWRLQNAGLKSLYIPQAVAYHARSVKDLKSTQNIKSVFSERKLRGQMINYLSYRNHIFTIIKNERLTNFLLHFIWIFFYEFKKFFYLLFFEPKILLAWLSTIKKLSKILKKRKIISTQQKVTNKEIRRWFF